MQADKNSTKPEPSSLSEERFCGDRGTPLGRLFCCRQGMVEAATQELASENRSLLRTRLLVVSAVSLLGYALFFLRSLFVDFPFFWAQLIPLTILTGAIVLLGTRRDLSSGQLRSVELGVFGSGLVYLVGIHYLAVLHFADQGDVVLTSVAMNQLFMSCFALLVIYGMFIPNTWRRALAVTIPMFGAPVFVSLYLWWGHQTVGQITANTRTWEQFSYATLLLAIGTLFSVLAAHIIHSIRKSAARQREMGRYRLQEKIGAGGMGEVWKAEHTLLARPAAIKMIRPEVLSTKHGEEMTMVRLRFEREAQATAGLRSPHTIHLYDFGVTDGGVFFYVMEFLEGLDLEKLVKRFGPIQPERVVYLLTQAAKSLAEAHHKGLVHRDIKPSNLYVSRLGYSSDFVKVLDFGLVKRVHSDVQGDTKLTQEGSTTGTPAYMSPEMALGNQEVDERSDIYSLGCVAYWMLTGHTVFEGKSPMETIVDHARTLPVPPSQRGESEVPDTLDQVILSCLEKEPEKRPQTMMELANLLASCQMEGKWGEDQAAAWWREQAS